jgi:prepilin peptidase CpaA
MLEAATLLVFPGLMVFAAFSDLFTMTISNLVSIALVCLFVLLGVASGLAAAEITWHLAGGALILIVGFALFTQGWIGGGDAKLAAATAAWLGLDHLAEYVLIASLLGGGLTLLILGLRHWPVLTLLIQQAWVKRLHQPGRGVPYGIALASRESCSTPVQRFGSRPLQPVNPARQQKNSAAVSPNWLPGSEWNSSGISWCFC